MKWARLQNGTVIEVTDIDPEGRFSPTLIWEEVPDETQPNSVLADGFWTHPEIPATASAVMEPPPPPEPAKLAPVQFKLLFTGAERIAIKAARSGDPVIADFFEILDDPRLELVDLGLASTQDVVRHLAAKGLVDAGRVTDILAGRLQ